MLSTSEYISINPFPGLRPFRTEETHLFFGREGQTDEVVEKLGRHRFVATLGASGSGKSSLMFCGLIPALYGGFLADAGSDWRVVVCRPGISPIANLAEALAESEMGEQEPYLPSNAVAQSARATRKDFYYATLRSSSVGLVEAVKAIQASPSENCLILIDQFEELFRFNRMDDENFSANEAAAFIKLFLHAVRQRQVPVYIVMTMRSDYIGDCSFYPQLTALINESHYLIPQMTREQKKAAILGPIAVGGGIATPRLIQQILNDLGDSPDQLPIMQHALMRTWDFWIRNLKDDEQVDLYHYVSIGRMAEALSRHADEAYEELDRRQKEICAVLFRTITEKGPDGRGVRRPTRLGEIAAIARADSEEVIAVIDRFRLPGRSLLTPPSTQRLTDQSVIDLSHESLMRIWIRCREWVEEEHEAMKTYLRLAEAAALYQMGKTGLWRPPDLQLALNWQQKVQPNLVWAERYDPSFERIMAFLDNSRKAYEEEQRSKERLQRRNIRMFKIVAAVLGAATIIALMLVIFANLKATEAEEQRLEALRQTEYAKESLQKAVESAKKAEEQENLATKEKFAALRSQRVAEDQTQIALGALKEAEYQKTLAFEAQFLAEKRQAEALEQFNRAEEARKEAAENLSLALRNEREANTAKARADTLRYLTIAQAMSVKSLQLKDTMQRALVARQAYLFNRQYKGNPNHPDVYEGLYNAERRVLGETFNAFRGHRDAVRSLAFFPAKEQLLSVGSDGQVLFWGKDRKPIPFTTESTILRKVDVSPDGEWLAVGTTDLGVLLYRTNGPSQKIPLNGTTPGSTPLSGNMQTGTPIQFNNEVWAVGFTKNSKGLLTAGADSSVVWWDLQTYKPRILGRAPSRIRDLAVGTNWVLTVHENGSLIRWALDSPGKRDIILQTKRDMATSVALHPNEQLAAIGYESGKVMLVNPLTGAIADELEGHEARISSLAFSPKGNYLAAGSFDGSARIWSTRQITEEPILLRDHLAWVMSVAFSADEKYLYVATLDKLIKRYPVNMEEMAARICGYLSRGALTPAEWEKFVGKDVPIQATCGQSSVQQPIQ